MTAAGPTGARWRSSPAARAASGSASRARSRPRLGPRARRGSARPTRSQATVDELRDAGADVIYVAADVAIPADRARLARARRGALRPPQRARQQRRPRAARARGSARGDRGELRRGAPHEPPGPVLPDAARGAVAHRRRHAAPDEPSAIVFVRRSRPTMVSPNRGEYCVSKAGWRWRPACSPSGWRRTGRGLRSAARRHRHGHDRRREGDVRPAHRRRPDSRQSLGHGRKTSAKVVAALVRGDVPYATGSVVHVDGALAIPQTVTSTGGPSFSTSRT